MQALFLYNQKKKKSNGAFCWISILRFHILFLFITNIHSYLSLLSPFQPIFFSQTTLFIYLTSLLEYDCFTMVC